MSSRDDDLREEDLNHLKEWLSKQPHMPKVPDEKLVLFLHCRDYNLELTKHTIEMYYTLRTHSPELFRNRDPLLPEIQEMMPIMSYVLLPDRDLDGHIVVISSFTDEDPAKFVHVQSLKLLYMYEDSMLPQIGRVKGCTVVVDAGNMKFGHLQRMNINIVRKHVLYLQEATPVKIRSFHVINTSGAAEKLFNLAKPFMAKRLVDKIIFHSNNLESLYKTVPREILPEDYGGKQKPMSELRKLAELKVVEMRDMLMKEEEQRIDESKRPADSKLSDFEEVSGSFKKLDFD